MTAATRTLPYFVWLGTTILWGTTWAVIRVGLRDLSPLTFAAARTTLAALVVLAAAHLWVPDGRPDLKETRFWLIVGVPQLGLVYALIFWAEQSISSGLTGMLFSTFPAITVVFAHFLLDDEPLTWRRITGALLAFVAVAVLVRPTEGPQPTSIWPVLAVLGAATSGSISTILVRGHGRRTSTLWLTAIQITSAAIFLIVLALVFEPQPRVNLTGSAVFSVVYLGVVVTSGCYLGLFWLLKRLDVTLVSMSMAGETTVAVFLGAALFGEPLGPRAVFGLVFVVLSVLLVSMRPADGASP